MKIFNSYRVYMTKKDNIMEREEDRSLRILVNEGFSGEIAERALHNVLKDAPAKDPSAASWSAWGFSAPSFFEDRLCLGYEGCMFFFAEKRERLLPGDVLKRAVAEEITALQLKQEEPVNKKQIAEIKDVVVARLLPKSHIKARTIPMMFTTVGDVVFLYVFTSSAKLAEDCLGLFRHVNATAPVYPFGYEFLHPVEMFLTDILRSPLDYPHFSAGKSASMFEKQQGTVVYKDAELDPDINEALRENLATGYYCNKLQYRFASNPGDEPDEYITVSMTGKGSFSGMKFSNMLEDRTRDEESGQGAREYFLAYGFILSRTLNDLIWNIRKAMAAGEKKAKSEGRITELGQTNLATDFALVEKDDEDEEL